MLGDNLPSPKEVLALYNQNNIQRMRLYGQNEAAFEALAGTNIELMLGVPNEELQGIASDQSNANLWVQNNVLRYPNVRFKYLAVGNEITPYGNSRYKDFLLPAMKNIYTAVSAAGLGNQIKVPTPFDYGVMQDTYPPSNGVFNRGIESFLSPIVQFLIETRAPFLLNMYPYFAYAGDQTNSISLSYALFTEHSANSVGYQNLFDAMLDATYSALEKIGGASVEVVVSETGWPTDGWRDTTMENARIFNSRLIQHVKQGTPKRPGRIETCIFAMFNENRKHAGVEQNWGLFYPDQRAKYAIDFN